MRTIWKAKLAPNDRMVVKVPRESVFLTVQMQQGIPVVWFEVEDTLPLEERYLYLAGTGCGLPEDEHLSYIGTFQTEGGHLVYHLFESLHMKEHKQSPWQEDITKGLKKKPRKDKPDGKDEASSNT